MPNFAIWEWVVIVVIVFVFGFAILLFPQIVRGLLTGIRQMWRDVDRWAARQNDQVDDGTDDTA